MADLYVDGVLGSDGNVGSAASPKKTLSAVVTFLTANPTGSNVYLAGTFVEQTMTLANLTDCTIQQWNGEGRLPCILRADSEITGSWTLLNGEYWATHAMTASPNRVFENWETRQDSNGNNLGAMDNTGIISGIGSLAENEWTRDIAADRIYVRLYDDDDPNDFTMTLVDSGLQGILLTACTNITIDGIAMWLYLHAQDTETSLPKGHGVQCRECINITVLNCEYRGMGESCVGITGDNDTAGSSGLLVSGCTVYSQGIQSGLVSIFGGQNVDVDDVIVEGFTYYASLLLDRNGLAARDQWASGLNRVPRCFWATAEDAVGSGELTNIIIRDGNIDGYNDAIFMRGANTSLADPTDPEDFNDYPVRVSNVRCVNMRSIIQHDANGYDFAAAFKSCLFHCPDMDTINEAATGRPQTRLIQVDAKPMYFESCDISADTGDENGTALVGCAAAQQVYFFNCILNCTNTGQTLRSLFVIDATSAIENIKCHQCLFITGGLRPVILVTGGSFAAVNFDFQDNWYEGNSSIVMSDNASFFSEAQWLASIDTGSVFNTDPELNNPPTDQEGIPNGNLHRKVRKNVLTASKPGINRNNYSSNYGCYQYGHYITGSGASLIEGLVRV